MDFSRIEAGETEVDALEFDLKSILYAVAEYARDIAERKGLQFNYSVDPDVWFTLVGDHARISQVLTNLLENAIKFTDSGMVQLSVTNAAARSM